MADAPRSTNLSTNLACVDRGQSRKSGGRPARAAEASSTLMIVTFVGVVTVPLARNNHRRAMLSSSATTDGTSAKTRPTAAVSAPTVVAQEMRLIQIPATEYMNIRRRGVAVCKPIGDAPMSLVSYCDG